MEPLISIVLPSFNGERYIQESINSIMEQTHRNWELIIVDDCSTDKTLQIASRYAILDKRIKVIHNEKNKKLPQSLNLGFKETKGEYLTWTSDDNQFCHNALEKMLQKLQNSPDAGLVCADMMIMDERGKDIEVEKTYQSSLCISNTLGACFLYRRDVYELVGEYDKSMFLVEDYDYWLRIEKNYRIVHINDVLYRYRRHAGSLSERKARQVAESRSLLRDKHKEYIFRQCAGDFQKLGIIFCDNCSAGRRKTGINLDIAEKYPEFQCLLIPKVNRGDAIIFGAGSYGRRCVTEITGDVLFFVDNNEALLGSFVDGYEVKSINELQSIDDSVCILIAVSDEKKPLIIKQVYEMGCRNYDIFS